MHVVCIFPEFQLAADSFLELILSDVFLAVLTDISHEPSMHCFADFLVKQRFLAVADSQEGLIRLEDVFSNLRCPLVLHSDSSLFIAQILDEQEEVHLEFTRVEDLFYRAISVK